jgi:DNA-binding transcriptional LysR family regulator
MASASPGWDLYRSFLAVLRLGSLSAAARTLGLTQPTLGRHIAELEAALGQPLFVRSQMGLSPTEAAQSLAPSAEAMEAAAAAFLRTASGGLDEAKGIVRLTASEFVGVEVLPPILTAFREAHPAIAIELAISDTNQDLSRRDADIAVRMARPTQAALVARRLGDVGIGLYAHRRYVARHGLPKTPGELPAHTIIGFDADTISLRVSRASGLRCFARGLCVPQRQRTCAARRLARRLRHRRLPGRGRSPRSRSSWPCCPARSVSISKCGW